MHSISKSSPAEAMMLSALSPTLWITILLGFSEKQIEKMLISFLQHRNFDKIPIHDTFHTFSFLCLAKLAVKAGLEIKMLQCFLTLLSQRIHYEKKFPKLV